MANTGLSGLGRAERVDPENGVREIAEFVGTREPMLRFVHLPRGAVLGTVVICSSVYAEFMKNYRREVRLARALAASGFAAVRIQYRGTGNSAGDPAALTMSSLVADIREMVLDLTERAELPASAYVGTRVGAMVAASAAPSLAPLVLWEPVLNGDRWLKEGIRAATISSVSRHLDEKPSDTRNSIARLESEGVLDLLGFALYRDLVNDIRRTNLEELLAGRQGRTLLLQIGAGSEPRPPYAQTIDRLRTNGAVVEYQAAGREVAWWFEDGGARDFESDDDVLASTVDWLRQVATVPR